MSSTATSPQSTLVNQRLLTRQDDLAISLIDTDSMSAPLQEGEVRLKLERFALTTNNITYAAFGDSIGYWQFFPVRNEGWGHMPVWGIARVAASRHPAVSEGQRFFGYYPMADYLKVEATRVSERGFRDKTDYRQPLPSAYNYYTRLDAPSAETTNRENYRMLLRPLFLTSYMLADYLQEADFFGAEQVVISSASSKTAYGTAFCLASHPRLQLIGLTSSGNQSFVENLNLYQQTLSYKDIEQLDNQKSTLYIDFSGNDQLRANLHQHLGANLQHDCYAGSAANPDFLDESRQQEVNAHFFFAALHIKKRNQELGAAVVSQRLDAMQEYFIDRASDPSNPWLILETHTGLAAASQVVTSLCRNAADPKLGHVAIMP